MIRGVLLALAVGLVAIISYACAPYLRAPSPSFSAMAAGVGAPANLVQVKVEVVIA
jgi:hypothetical protein